LDKAVEIKRRAQRCVQNGDLDGALSEYQKLVAVNDTDPYNFVLLADLLYKKGDHAGAGDRYLSAAAAYEKAGLYKNGIAVCKKMMRLSLSHARVLKQLAALHAADGLGTEAALYYMQYAEHEVRAERYEDAADALRKAFEASNENVKALERLAEVLLLEDDRPGAARGLAEAAHHYAKSGQLQAAEQCKRRGRELNERAFEETQAGLEGGLPPRAGAPAAEPAVQGIDRFERPSRPVEVERDADLEIAPPRLRGAAGGAAPGGGAESDDDDDEVDAGVAEQEMASGDAEQTAAAPPPAERIRTIESAWTGETADPPGLLFGGPAARPAPARSLELAKVEKLLAEAQEAFKAGDREKAGQTLAVAAETYETAGQLDQAATIYRSLAKSAQAPAGILERWLDNCTRREDLAEAAHVACELGDRALATGRLDEAREWFETAVGFEPGNELAGRRLQRLGAAAPAAGDDAPAPAAGSPRPEPADAKTEHAPGREAEPETEPATNGAESGRVELAVGRGEAVTFDLGSLISEFQRGVEAQLSGDAQSHYDLAMAYREMGLLEQAVDSFRIAQKDAAFGDRCAEMIGRCLLDQGRFEDAAAEFQSALESGRLDMETEVNLRYQLGLAHEAAGRMPDALSEFEGVYAAQPNYPDVALKIRVLLKSLENL
jgi:tetratricopeptide (TPR) repeat protein